MYDFIFYCITVVLLFFSKERFLKKPPPFCNEDESGYFPLDFSFKIQHFFLFFFFLYIYSTDEPSSHVLHQSLIPLMASSFLIEAMVGVAAFLSFPSLPLPPLLGIGIFQ